MSSIEDKIISALHEGCTYKEIQLKCGSPSKNFIKKVIKERDPELYEIISDTKKLKEYRDKQFKESLNG